MVRMGTIRDDFFRKRILRDRFFVIVLTVVVLLAFYFFGRSYLRFALLIFAALFLLDLPGLIRRFRNHRRLIYWLDHHRDLVILAYSGKVKYIETIEKYVIPYCPPNIRFLKIDEDKLRGDIPRHIWFELARRTRMPQLPVIINLHHRSYRITQIRRYLNDFLEDRNGHDILLDNIKMLWTPHNSNP